MSYGSYANYRMNRALNVPFGESVYMAVDAATRMVGKAFWATKVKVRERAATNALAALHDQILNDIGVPRSEIRFLARKVAENPDFDHRTMCR